MGKNYIRVDDRLIHGQIIASWAIYLNIKNIIAIDDKTAANPMLSSIMAMSVPKKYKTKICSFVEAQDILTEMKNSPDNNLIITRFPRNLLAIFAEGIEAESIHIGSVAKKNGSSVQITANSYLDFEDMEALEKLHREGRHIVFQLVPDSAKVCWDKVRDKYVK